MALCATASSCLIPLGTVTVSGLCDSTVATEVLHAVTSMGQLHRTSGTPQQPLHAAVSSTLFLDPVLSSLSG